MPTREFRLDPPARLTLTWAPGYRSTELRLDGTLVGTVADRAGLARGARMVLPDGRELGVRLVAGLGIDLVLGGARVPGSACDPGAAFRRAARAAYVLAVLDGIAASLAFLVDGLGGGDASNLPIAVESAIAATLLPVIARAVRRRSVKATVAAIAVSAVDGLATIAIMFALSRWPTSVFATAIVRMFVIAPMWRAIRVARAIGPAL